MDEKKTLYLCDPDRNEGCKKRMCGYYFERGGCFATHQRAYAKTDENGTPIVWPLKIGSFIQDKNRLAQTIVDMNRIREVGIVNARQDLDTIDDALGWLMLLDAMIQ